MVVYIVVLSCARIHHVDLFIDNLTSQMNYDLISFSLINNYLSRQKGRK